MDEHKESNEQWKDLLDIVERANRFLDEHPQFCGIFPAYDDNSQE